MKLIVVYILIFGLKLISPEQMDKLWHIQMIDYCTAMRKNDLQLNRACMNLTNIRKSERSQTLLLLLLLLSCFSHVRLCVTPSLGFSRQEHRSGLPFPSPIHESGKWKWSRSVMSHSLRPHGLQPTRLLCLWDFPGKSTGVGCHCLLWSWTLKSAYYVISFI